MTNFEIVSKYKDAGVSLPVRGTARSAGYDLAAAADIVIPPYMDLIAKLAGRHVPEEGYISLDKMAALTKSIGAKPSLITTGLKCQLEDNEYLELVSRSSSPLKYWLICANSVGIIDADYYNNPDNEGEIFFQVINLSPMPIKISKGEKICQGIIRTYGKTDNDRFAATERVGGFGSTSGTVFYGDPNEAMQPAETASQSAT